MAVNIHNLIAAINPKIYCNHIEVEDENGKKVWLDKYAYEKLKEGIKEKNKKSYIDVAKKIKELAENTPEGYKPTKAFEAVDFVKLFYTSPQKLTSIFKNPIEQHKLIYDSFGESLEPIYFWILDTIQNLGFEMPEKLIDNFISSPGSGHFSEVGMKATRMQEEGMKMLGAANQVLKSILNIIYDLKEFKMRLQKYEELKSKEKEKKEAAMYSLKQIWMDSVDIKRGNTSLKGMASQFDYVTMIDAFMMVENEKLESNGKPLDLNDRVKRILQQRISEFLVWLKESELELKKRYEIEKNYLRSQYNTIQMYARWAKPYLRAAKQLEQNASPNASLVNQFNTTLFELTLLAKSKYNVEEDIAKGDLPKSLVAKLTKKKYYDIVILEFRFRSSPEKFGQNYGFRGRTEVVLTSYSLNEDELDVLRGQIEKDDFGDVLQMIEGATTESLEKIQNDIDDFLNEENIKKEEEKKENEEDSDPFSSLFSFFTKDEKVKKKDEKKEKKKDLKEGLAIPEEDTEVEKIARALSIVSARRRCVKFYEVYKKAHQIVCFDTLDDVF